MRAFERSRLLLRSAGTAAPGVAGRPSGAVPLSLCPTQPSCRCVSVYGSSVGRLGLFLLCVARAVVAGHRPQATVSCAVLSSVPLDFSNTSLLLLLHPPTPRSVLFPPPPGCHVRCRRPACRHHSDVSKGRVCTSSRASAFTWHLIAVCLASPSMSDELPPLVADAATSSDCSR